MPILEKPPNHTMAIRTSREATWAIPIRAVRTIRVHRTPAEVIPAEATNLFLAGKERLFAFVPPCAILSRTNFELND
jgi:hypothetical protein